VGVLAPVIVVLFAFMFVNSGPDERRQRALAEQADEAAVTTTRPDVAGGLGGDRTDTDPETDPESEPGAGRGDEPRRPETTSCPEELAAISGGEVGPLAAGPIAAGPIAVDDCGPDDDVNGGTAPTAPANPSGGAVPGLPPNRTVDRYAFCAAAQGFAAFELEVTAAILRGDGGGVRTAILAGRDRWRTDVDAMVAAGPADLQVDIRFYQQRYASVLDTVTPETVDVDIMQAMAALGDDDMARAAGRMNQRIVDECE